MELQTISQVSKEYSVTPRMLRYYEQAGLIKSQRKDDYAYRVYDADAINRLRQIIVLRKLRIPVKQIISILNHSDTAEIVEIFQQNISQIDEEITALSTVKAILTRFVEELNEKANINLKLLENDIFSVIDSFSFSDNKLKNSKENLSMEELNKANEAMSKLAEKSTPIVVKTYSQNLNAMRFIGKKYSSGANAWEEWTEADEHLLKSHSGINLKDFHEDGDSLIGLMCHRNGDHNHFEYWLGYFMPQNTPVPEGFAYEDFPKVNIGVCWIYGHQDEVFGLEPMVFEKLKEEGFNVSSEWWFERYHPLRSAEDKNRNFIIDICFFIK